MIRAAGTVRIARLLVALLVYGTVACGDGGGDPDGAGPLDASPPDVASSDAPPVDAAPVDGAPVDAAPFDGMTDAAPPPPDAAPPLTLTLDVAPGGAVLVTPPGVACAGACAYAYPPGTMVSLAASAAGCASFSGFTGGGCDGAGDCTLTMDADTSVAADFTGVAVLEVGAIGVGAGTITSSPAGINCGADCSEVFATCGTPVTLTATAAAGSYFEGWSGACSELCPCNPVVSGPGPTPVTATFDDARLVWAVQLMGIDNDEPYDVVAAPSGDVYLVGTYQGPLILGPDYVPTNGGSDVFVVKLSAGGAYLWSQHFGSTGYDFVEDAEVNDAGDLVLVGHAAGAVDFGAGLLPAFGGGEIFVVSYAAADGALRWARLDGGPVLDRGFGVAIDAAGDVYVTGDVGDGADLGGGPIATMAASQDVFVAKYAGADGAYVDAQVFGGTASDAGRSLALDAMGAIYLTGDFVGTMDVGCASPLLGAGAWSDVFLVKFDAAGVCQWKKRFGSGGFDGATRLVLSPAGSVVVTGTYWMNGSFGGSTLANAGMSDVFLTSHTLDGSYQWSHGYGGPGNDLVGGLGVDAAGNLLAVGHHTGDAGFGGPLFCANDYFLWFGRYDAAGAHLWSRQYGHTFNAVYGKAAAVTPSGNLLLAGYYGGTVDIGGGPLPSAGSYDTVLFELAP